jgi:hypothetical protein
MPDTAEKPKDPMVGATLGGFRLIEMIGAGGMGRVYKAYDEGLDRFVAVKVLPAAAEAVDPAASERFLREARAMAKLKHRNLISIYGVGEEGGVRYFAMELVASGSLSDRVKAGPVPLEEVWKIAAQVISALALVHRAGLVHRDIKPGNVLMDEGGRAVLTDFGLAKDEAAPGVTAAGMVMGTPEYLSPEQCEGRTATSQSDIYAVGVMLFQMLTGRLPFRGKSVISILRDHVETPVPRIQELRPDAPAAQVAVVMRCLEKSPAARYAGLPEMARDILAFHSSDDLADLAAAAPPISQQGTIALPATARAAGGPAAMGRVAPAKPAAGIKKPPEGRPEGRPRPKTVITPIPARRPPVWIWIALAAGVLIIITLILVLIGRPKNGHQKTAGGAGTAGTGHGGEPPEKTTSGANGRKKPLKKPEFGIMDRYPGKHLKLLRSEAGDAPGTRVLVFEVVEDGVAREVRVPLDPKDLEGSPLDLEGPAGRK